MSRYYTVVRTVGANYECAPSKRVVTWRGMTLREAGQMVFYCALDNLAWPRALASKAGVEAERHFKRGDVFHLGASEFEFRAVGE